MTHVAGGSGRRVTRGWILPLAATVAILSVTAAGLFSRSIVYDFLAWWPVWLLLAILVWAAKGRRIGRLRVSGVIPFVALVALGLFVAAYWQGWQVMPSAGIKLVGPDADSAEQAAVAARIDGALVVGPLDSPFLYEVSPLREGGDVGSPEATEQVQGLSFAVSLQPVSDPGLYTFGGWDLALARTTRWALTLSGEIEADLSPFEVSELQLLGRGVVVLGVAVESTPLTVDGDFELAVPSGAPVRIIGAATVPDGWEQTTEGSTSPTSGEGWVISVDSGSTLIVTSP